jgi:hypothetical protein
MAMAENQHGTGGLLADPQRACKGRRHRRDAGSHQDRAVVPLAARSRGRPAGRYRNSDLRGRLTGPHDFERPFVRITLDKESH